MTTEPRIDQTVCELARAVIAEREPTLSAVGLRATADARRWSMDGVESSELRMTFWRGTALIDVLEDFIVRDGEAAASMDEFKRWIEDGIDTIVSENPAR